jgi:4-hydroxybenzoate polyprenyltransferase
VGYPTTAVIIGRRATYWLGVCCFGTAGALTVVLSFLDVLFTRDLLVFQAAAALVQLVVYAVLMRRPSFSRVGVVSVLFVLNGIVLLLGYVAR